MDTKNRNDIIILPRLGKYASRKEWEVACWKRLLRSPGRFYQIMTSYERHDIVMRAAVAHLLSLDLSYRDIGRELWLSPQTISVVKKGLLERGYRSYAVREKVERKKRVYSVDHRRPHRKIPMGQSHRTKYGTIHL